jgi:hypothetical protein
MNQQQKKNTPSNPSLWRVKASTGELSAALPYDLAVELLREWRTVAGFENVRFKKIKVK